MDRTQHAVTVIVDSAMFAILFTLAVFATVMPALTIAIGIPALVVHRLVTKRYGRP